MRAALLTLLLLTLPAVAQASCKALHGRDFRLSNGILLSHLHGDLFRAPGLSADTYNVQIKSRKYVLMRVSYEQFKCFD
ncbi:hypothetical protein [Chitinibacter sp. ZOR0017]|jgi:type V secretory pathway adhesin AidA|uniref:hypothetical protein n=1 Tax=Chitinibacter sp. ZOR0017 TaxID=1339254 RepID=UPI000648AF96|nr:hypothetical protein [Chitinibacter sp. ZOR0017]